MIKIAILGLGTVGTGVARVVADNARQIERKLGEPLQVKSVLVRRFKDGPYRQLMTDDFSRIENDPEIRVVVETIGGVEAAYEYTKRALEAGKHVVTANKQLVAEKGAELLALAARKKVHYLFEASVGGGIPVLHPIRECLAANRIEEIYGILNGTTNYILTRMVRTGAFFTDALREAQAKGYAEADPTADVQGIDAGRKTCILADLAFGHEVPPEKVPMEGITKLSLRDVKIAERAGYRIKLLGRTVRMPGGGCTAYVAPHLIPEEHPMANVEDVFNAVAVRGNATGEVMFYGKGAGELPTASACVSDVMEALTTSASREEPLWSADGEGFVDPDELHTRFYFRIEGSLTDAAMAFGQVEVLSEDGETAFLTERISGTDARQQSAMLNVLACMRVMN
ncbi:homoserine dehydrogenase [Dysosmobacter sp.]|uniref:homoserine dehydrogenase n=1 Tax=Dysosmobacter sp. TaxID=2591382 RepID=UPI002A88C4AE|nr:homoserine dehydrogenase [Dysosmobacter sp.]MDY3282667.1 homoserine dehydrogenase [Dysosmobacter sp.]